MLKIACTLTGDNYQLVVMDTPASKKKIIAMALAMMVPVLIWIFNGFMLSWQVLETGLVWAIATGVVCGLIIFIIEKLIVMANGNRWLSLFRISIGLIVAALGSIAIDEVVFKKDIDISVAKQKESAVQESRVQAIADFEKENGYSQLNDDITRVTASVEAAEKAVIDEANGTYGTGVRGAGIITQLKEGKAAARREDLQKLLAQKEMLEKDKQNKTTDAGKNRKATYHENALLIRIKALFSLIAEDRYMLIIYILFTLLLFFFEFLVVVLKLTWKKTHYELRMQMIEDIGRKRMEFLLQKNSPLSDPGLFMPEYAAARNAILVKKSLFH